VSAIIFDDKKIMPSKFYVGMHVLDDEGNVIAKSEKWHNSKEGMASGLFACWCCCYDIIIIIIVVVCM
jgi:hypothetical protein